MFVKREWEKKVASSSNWNKRGMILLQWMHWNWILFKGRDDILYKVTNSSWYCNLNLLKKKKLSCFNICKKHESDRIIPPLFQIKEFLSCFLKLVHTRKYPLRGYILGVLTHTTAWDRHWEGDEKLIWFCDTTAGIMMGHGTWDAGHEK